MRKLGIKAVRLTIIVLLILSFDVNADSPKNYWQLKLGMFTPTGDLDDAYFERGGNLELVYGRYISPNFAISLGSIFWACCDMP